MTQQAVRQGTLPDWTLQNRAYLHAQLVRLRLRLKRRVRWLRSRRSADPVPGYSSMVISEAEADCLLEAGEREAELRFYFDDPEASALSRELAEAERELANVEQQLERGDQPPAIQQLATVFGLSPFERDVLLLCLAPALDAGFSRLFAYLNDQVQARQATPHLALSVLTTPAEPEAGDDEAVLLAARASFLLEAPLRRFLLVTLEPDAADPAPPYGSAVQLDERVSSYLEGVNLPDRRVARALRRVPELPLTEPLAELCERLAGVIDRQSTAPVLNLIGFPGAGQDVIARAVCERLGLELFQLDAALVPTDSHERERFARLLDREAALLPMMPYLDLDAVEADDRETRRAVLSLIGLLDTGSAVASQSRLQVDRPVLVCPIPKPDAEAQRGLWGSLLGESLPPLEREVEQIVHQFDFGPRAIAEVVAAARAQAELRHEAVSAEDLWQTCRGHLSWSLDDSARRIVPAHVWDDLVLPEAPASQLREIAAQVAHRSTVYERWGFGAQLGRGRGISALFAGPSGTGKTMAAEVLAHHLRLDLYKIDLAGVVSKYIGETEKRLRRVFDLAESCGAILFFDEADALFGKRTEVKDSHDRYANIEVNYLLQRMEDYRGLAILATNRKSSLDQAFLRRLRFLLDFPFPSPDDRRRIWKKVFPARARLDVLDLDALCRLEVPGGNIRNIALNAAFLAAEEKAPIGMTHVMRAARREYAKIDKMITEAEFGPYYRQVQR